MRWGLIGAGDIVRRRVAAALGSARDSALVGLSRRRADLVDASARAFGAARAFRDWRDLVADPGIDAVYIATPVGLHATQTIAAARAGKHVLCEKPMALDVDECDRMIAACSASGVRLGIAYYRRFYPAVARIAALIAGGEIGTPVLAQMNAFEPFDPQPGDERSWLLDPAQSGGGPLADFGCHRLEVLQHLFGRARRVAGIVDAVALRREVEDTAAVALQFDHGVCAMLAVTHAAALRQDTFDLYATRGSIRMASLNAGDLVITSSGGERRESHPPAENVHVPLIEDFVDAVQSGREPAVSGAVGREVAELQHEIYAHTSSVR